MSPARATATAVRRGRSGHPGASQRRPATPAAGSVRRRRLVGLVPGLLVGLLAGGGVGFLTAPDGNTAGTTAATAAGQASAPVDDADPRVAELEAEAGRRDAEAVVLLTRQATELVDLLGPVVTAAGAHVAGSEPGDPAPPVPSPADLGAWRDAAAAGVDVLGDPPSAGTDVNVARAGFTAALAGLTTAIEALWLAADVQTGGGDPLPAQQLAGSALRGSAATWSVGATQLDAFNVDAGHGHVHLHLPAVAGSGALTADPAPTGRAESPG